MAISKAARPATLLAAGSVLMLGFMAQLSTFALATDYTTTQTQSLQEGDTVTTTGDKEYGWDTSRLTPANAAGGNTITTSGTSAYGLNLVNSNPTQPQDAKILTATGLTIRTSGRDANGVYVSATPGPSGGSYRSDATLTFTDSNITTTGEFGHGIYLYQAANLTLNNTDISAYGDDAVALIADTTDPLSNTGSTVVINGGTFTSYGNVTSQYSTGGAAVKMYSGSKLTMTDATVKNAGTGGGAMYIIGSTADLLGHTIIETDADAYTNPADTPISAALLVNQPKANVNSVANVASTVQIISRGKNASGATINSGTLNIQAATIAVYGEGGYALRAAGGNAILNGTTLVTHANGGAAILANSRSSTISGTVDAKNINIITSGDNARGVVVDNTGKVLLNNASTIKTTGMQAHGLSYQGGANKIYSRTLSGTITVLGKDSAALHVRDGGTIMDITDVLVTPNIILGADSWTALAEDGGTISIKTWGVDFDDGGFWARGSDAASVGTILLGSRITAAGSRLRADTNGVIDISSMKDKTDFSVGSVLGNGGIIKLGDTNLTVDGDAQTTYAGVFDGTGSLIRGGTNGSTTLTGDNSAYTAAVSVTGGSLYVDGPNGKIGGSASVTGGALGGSGAIGGDVAVSGGGSLAGRQGQVLTIGGNLSVASDGIMTVALGAPEVAGTSGLFNVTGDVALDGKLNITDQGGFAPGLYRIVDYTGTLTRNTMTIGDVPVDTDVTQMSIQTSVANQVNLLNMSGAELNFWDGGNMANHGNNDIDGGTGTWNKANTNWADKDGALHGAWSDGQYAIFTGTAGTVTVDNSGGDIVVDGMQFAVDGYRIEGDAITLQDGEAIIRVGVGNSSGMTMSATIASELKGNGSLTKSDLGTLILTADNSYTGGTTVTEGILQLGDDGATGSVQGDITNNATLAVNRSDAYTLSGRISGSGALAQNGTGTLILTSKNSYTGGTTIKTGSTLQLGDGNTSGSITGNVTNDGVLAINRSDRVVLDGAISGTGSLQHNGTGTTVLTGNSAWSGGTTINAGTLQIGKGGTTGSIAGDVTNNGTLSFNRSNQLIFSKSISGTGSVTQDGAGTTLMTGANAYTGATRVNAGTLQQKMHGSFSAASDYYVAANATLDNGGYKTTLKSLDNSGTVNFGINPGAVVTVTGNYTGHDGMIIMNAELNGDDSRTDLLQVSGNTSGTTTVKVVNSGGPGAQTKEGIKIIDVKGSSTGTFTLAGDYKNKDGQQAVVAGAYVYSLYSGSVSTPADGDWYLRSALKDGTGPALNPGIPLYQGAIAAMQTLNKLPTLQQRVGSRYWNGAANPVIEQGADAIGTPLVSADEAGTAIDQRGIWGRIEGAHNRLEPNGSGMKQDINTYLMQTGVDGQFYEGESGKLIGGITGQYGNAHSDIASKQSDGDVETQAWGLGGTLTWYGDHGFYVDTQAQANWYDNDFNSTTANKSLANGRKGFGYALSAEAGQRIDLNDNWSLTPQAQLMWSAVDFDSFNDVWDTAVALRDGDNLTARIGISADYRKAWRDANGQLTRTSLYGIANLYQEMLGDMSVKVAGVNFGTGNDKTWGGLGLGGTYAWADDKYALYSEGSLNTSLNSFAKSYSVKGTVGLRVKW